jgi:aspartate dehydrogenase
MKLAIIGDGAIGRYVRQQALQRGFETAALLVRPQRLDEQPATASPVLRVCRVAELPGDIDLVVDCAGHSALQQYGADILGSGTSLLTVSLGALADAELFERLQAAAAASGARLHLASGAIGALDCLRAARVGKLDAVTYTGRKPPLAWQGSPAAAKLDLGSMTGDAQVHFSGSARTAALEYPKNANVAAAVALAGIGFDATQVQLIADPGVSENIHELQASGEFGSFSFEIRGHALPDNPRSSALAAMSVISALEQARALERTSSGVSTCVW